MLDIYLDKLYRYPRIQECVSVAVPFKKGELKSISEIAVLQNGKECIIQPEVTSSYDDGSVKFLFISFMADLPANKRTKVILSVSSEEYDKAVEASKLSYDNPIEKDENVHKAEVCVKKTEAGYTVSSGELEFDVSDNSESIFTRLVDGRKIYTEENFEGPVLKDREGNDYKMSIGEWRVVKPGPVEVTLSAKAYNVVEADKDGNTASIDKEDKKGIKNKNIESEIRITAYAGKPWVNISYRIINTSDEELNIKSLVFYIKKSKDSRITDKLVHIDMASGNDSTGCGDILTDNSNNNGPIFMTRGIGELDMIEHRAPVSDIRTMVATSNYKTSFIIGKNGEEVNETIDDSYLIKEANEHYAEVLYGTFMADYTDADDGFCVTVHQAQQNYPKAIKSCAEGVAVMLVPEGVGEITMQSGMAKEQNFLIHWHSPETHIWEIDNRSLIYQMPDRPYIAPQIFKESVQCLMYFLINMMKMWK